MRGLRAHRHSFVTSAQIRQRWCGRAVHGCPGTAQRCLTQFDRVYFDHVFTNGALNRSSNFPVRVLGTISAVFPSFHCLGGFRIAGGIQFQDFSSSVDSKCCCGSCRYAGFSLLRVRTSCVDQFPGPCLRERQRGSDYQECAQSVHSTHVYTPLPNRDCRSGLRLEVVALCVPNLGMSKLTRSPSKLVGGPVLSAGKNFPAIPNVRVGSVQKVTFLSPKLAACADSAPTLDEPL